MSASLSPNHYGNDGDDHINISPYGKTHLGRLLDPSYVKPFTYPHIGKFNSVLGLWEWLKHNPSDDRCRKASGFELKKLAIAQKSTMCYVPNFKAIIAQATYIKLKNDPFSLDTLIVLSQTKTLLSYYTPGNGVVRLNSAYSHLLLEVIGCVIQTSDTLKKPCFLTLCDKPGLTGWNYLEGYLRDRLSQEMCRQLRLD